MINYKTVLLSLLLLFLLAAALCGKACLSGGMQSPVFVDEIGYADVAHEIAVRRSWKLRYDLPQSFPPWYSAVLAP